MVVAAAADEAGVPRVGVDLERLGKAERQAGLHTWISSHSIADLRSVGTVLTRAGLFARVNPVHHGSEAEIAQVLRAGARFIMAPMIGSADEAAEFAGLVGGRACAIALVEAREGIERLESIASAPGIDEVHVGLNDLALSLRLPSRWAVLAGNLMKDAAACVRGCGRPFGFGGIGCAHDERLPIPSDLVYAEYARTGSTRALLSRSFDRTPATFGANVDRALVRLEEWRAAEPDAIEAAHAELGRRVGLADTW